MTTMDKWKNKEEGNSEDKMDYIEQETMYTVDLSQE